MVICMSMLIRHGMVRTLRFIQHHATKTQPCNLRGKMISFTSRMFYFRYPLKRTSVSLTARLNAQKIQLSPPLKISAFWSAEGTN